MFEPLVGLVEEHRLSGGGPAKGFCMGDLGRTVNPKLWQQGHNNNYEKIMEIFSPSEKIDAFSTEKYGITWDKKALFSADF